MTAENTTANGAEPTTQGGWRSVSQLPSLPEVFRTVAVPTAGNPLRKLFAFAGPAIWSRSATWTPATGRPTWPAVAQFGYTLLVGHPDLAT